MTIIVGHRGGRNLWPENGMAGFRNLQALPVDAVEFDVHLSDAGEMLIIHDATLDRTTDRTGPVRRLAPGERHGVTLKGPQGSGTDKGIPVLDEVLALYEQTGIELHVEIKANEDGVYYPGLVAKAAAAIDARGLGSRSYLTCFSFDVLAEIKSVAPHIRRLISFHDKSAEKYGARAGLERAAQAADIVAVERTFLSANWDLVTGIVPKDRICAWVPNTVEDLEAWFGKGLHAVTSDRPDLAVEVRSRVEG